MAIYTVDTVADIVAAGDGVLSLREALALAEANFDADTILFADVVQGRTIVLAGSQLTVSSLDAIDGGTGVTIDADEKSRVLLVQGGGGGGTLGHLTITGGRTTGDEESGGGIRVEGNADLTLDHVTISGNSTAGYEAKGGGIWGYDVTLTNSTVSGNSTAGKYAEGGGIAGDYIGLSYVTLINSTVSGNSTAGEFACGGGVTGGNVSLTNSTVSGNSTTGDGAKGGGIWGFQTTLTNSTVTANSTEGTNYAGGGGIYAYTDGITLANSIVAGNTAAGSADPDVAGGVRASNGLNILGSDVDGSAPSDRENVSPSVLFAGGLADNGGPTQTIALRDASDNPALGRADPACATAADQRGVQRPQPADTNPDIGAFELDQSAPTPPPSGTTLTVTTATDVSADDGLLSLREALALADADNLTADVVEFAPEVQGQTIVLAGSQLTINSDVTIDGGTGVTIDANLASRVLLVQGLGTEAVARQLKITGGRVSGAYDTDGGGGIRAEKDATLSLDRAIISGNTAAGGGGGGIYGYSVTLSNSTVSDNSTTYGGGGIRGRTATLVDCTVTGNSGAVGGGIYGTYVALTNSTVNGNSTTKGGGGGIYGVDVTVTNSTVSGNIAAGMYRGGGGIDGFSLAVTNSTIVGNSVAGGDTGGGGIYSYSAVLVNNIVAGNTTADSIAPDVAGYFYSNGHNIFGSEVEGSAPGDLKNIATSLLFAGDLADNGGPTQTIALRNAADNPALGAADPADAPATDQRGEARPQPVGTSPDIGAFELDQTAVAVNEIVGTARGEFLGGTAGADLMRGFGGDDRLWGRRGDDTLFGGTGNDVLAGNAGIDGLTSGNGADRFLFRRVGDTPAAGPSYDEILDFSRAQGDQIDLRPIDAKRGIDCNQKFGFIGDDPFTRAGQLRFEAAADGDFLVSGNVDRDLAADFAFIVRTGLQQLREGDFLL